MENLSKNLKLIVGSDHAGFELKTQILQKYSSILNVEDLGTNSQDSSDYPIFAEKVARRILSEPSSLGLLICGTGIGMAIAANKIDGIRAASVSEAFSARMAREHNQAQILCLGARVVDFEKACECLEAFLKAEFDRSNGRHQRRLDEIEELERKKNDAKN